MAITRSQAKALEKQMAVAEAEAVEVEAVEVETVEVEVKPGVEDYYCDESPISSPEHVYEPIELFPIASIEYGKQQVSIIEQPLPRPSNEGAKAGGLVLVGLFGAVGITVAWKYSSHLTKSVKNLLKKWFWGG